LTNSLIPLDAKECFGYILDDAENKQTVANKMRFDYINSGCKVLWVAFAIFTRMSKRQSVLVAFLVNIIPWQRISPNSTFFKHT
jgi:hypothetical protein